MKEAEIKGQAIRTTLDVIGELFGESVQRAVFDGLQPDFAEALRLNSIMHSGWYPISWYRQIHESLSRQLPNVPSLASRIGRTTTEHDLSGTYRFILKLTSPKLIARHFDKVTGAYLRGGTVKPAVSKDQLLIDCQGWYGMSSSIWSELTAGMEVILEASGAKRVRSEWRELGPGSYEVKLTWD